MNSKSVDKLITNLGLTGTWHVKGERSGTSRWFTVTLHAEADHGRAADIKAAVLAEGNRLGLGVGCDVVPQVNPFGHKLA